jgi:hypothetical protein
MYKGAPTLPFEPRTWSLRQGRCCADRTDVSYTAAKCHNYPARSSLRMRLRSAAWGLELITH